MFTKYPVKEGGRNPYVDWMMILIVSSIVALLLIANSIYLYKSVTNGDIQSKEISTATTTEIFDVKGLDAVTSKFKEKKDFNLKIKDGFKTVADPAI